LSTGSTSNLLGNNDDIISSSSSIGSMERISTQSTNISSESNLEDSSSHNIIPHYDNPHLATQYDLKKTVPRVNQTPTFKTIRYTEGICPIEHLTSRESILKNK